MARSGVVTSVLRGRTSRCIGVWCVATICRPRPGSWLSASSRTARHSVPGCAKATSLPVLPITRSPILTRCTAFSRTTSRASGRRSLSCAGPINSSCRSNPPSCKKSRGLRPIAQSAALFRYHYKKTMSDEVNILLVDDHPQNLLALESILRGLSQNVVQATSGPEALKYLLRNDAAVILLDVEMPDMDGFQTATLIRNRDKSFHTPIIFLSGISKNDVHVSQGYSLGVVDYIFKPFSPDV